MTSQKPTADPRTTLFLLGVATVVAQALLLREAMAAMGGSEIAWGAVMAVWLFGMGFGSRIGASTGSESLARALPIVVLVMAGFGVVLFRAAPVLIGENGVIVVTSDGILYRIQDDQISWRRKLPGAGTYGAPIVVRHHHDQILVGDGSGAVSSFTGNGALMWRLEMGSAVHVLSGPVNGLMLGGTENNGVSIFTGTGRFLGTLESGGAVHGISFLARESDALAVYGARDGFVRAYSLTLSKKTWEPPAP